MLQMNQIFILKMQNKFTHWVIPGSGKPIYSVLQTAEQQKAFNRILSKAIDYGEKGN